MKALAISTFFIDLYHLLNIRPSFPASHPRFSPTFLVPRFSYLLSPLFCSLVFRQKRSFCTQQSEAGKRIFRLQADPLWRSLWQTIYFNHISIYFPPEADPPWRTMYFHVFQLYLHIFLIYSSSIISLYLYILY